MRGPGGAGARERVRLTSSPRRTGSPAAIADALAGGTPPGEILALARTGYATEPLQRALAHAGIPHRVLGSLGLYERTEVRDALAYLTLLENPADAQAFRRAVGSPRRGIGTATATELVALAARARTDGDLIAASAHADAARRHPLARGARPAGRFGAGLERVRRELAAGRSIGHVVVATVMLARRAGPPLPAPARHTHRTPIERRDAERVLEDLRSLCRAAQAYAEQQHENATLTGFLEHAAGLHAQEIDAGEPDRRITVSTIHRAKGTEAQLVALLGCEERLLPSWRALASPDPEQLAEERRLFYVAATRAKDRLLITHAADARPPAHRRPLPLPRRSRADRTRPRRSPPEHQPARTRSNPSCTQPQPRHHDRNRRRDPPRAPTPRPASCCAGRSRPARSASAR